MKVWFALWDAVVLVLWSDAEKTALKCEAWHKSLVERLTRK